MTSSDAARPAAGHRRSRRTPASADQPAPDRSRRTPAHADQPAPDRLVRRPGPQPDRSRLEPRDIVAAAIRVLDRSGLDGLTMRRVAEELDAQAASLYHHVRDKEHLVDLLGDALLGEIDPGPPPAAAWRPQLAWLMGTARRALLRHRDAGRVLGGRFPLGPNGLALTEQILTILARAGFPPRQAAFALFAVSSYVIGFVSQEVEPMTAEERETGDNAAALAALRRRIAGLDPARFPQLSMHAAALTEEGMDQRFEFGLGRLLAGLRPPRPRRG